MASFLNWQDPPTTGAPMSTIIAQDRVLAEPVRGVFGNQGGSPPPTAGQLYPRGVPTQ